MPRRRGRWIAIVAILAAVFIAIGAVQSLVAIMAIYREGGILKRLRATPLRPWTILTAHVLVKLLMTAVTLALMILAGKRYYPADVHAPVIGFTIALLFSTWSILSIGFVIASIVPTARFAQPIGGVILYPMVALSGLFVLYAVQLWRDYSDHAPVVATLDEAIGARASDPSQVKVNWQPVVRVEPWNTTPHTLDG